MLVRSSARLRYVSIPPRKMRLVGDMVKGLQVEEALDILNFTPRIAARHLAKTLKSAAANALSLEGTDHLRPEALMVKNVIVDAAPTAKRIRFQSMGRVFRIKKRYCHLTIELEGEIDALPKKAAATSKTRDTAKKDQVKKSATKKTTKKKSSARKTGKARSATKRKTAKTSARKKSRAAGKKKSTGRSKKKES